MMNVLEDKGYLQKESDGRAHVYTPTKPRQQVVGAMVRDFIDRVFDGASSSLLLHLAKDSKLTDRQRKAVQKIIQELEE
jgi:BlaI family transcriptional regulator, penicillinase repressor